MDSTGVSFIRCRHSSSCSTGTSSASATPSRGLSAALHDLSLGPTAATATATPGEAVVELRVRLRAVQEDRDHRRDLAARAAAAFERHRTELTQLRQKERAVFAAGEDRLRAELHALLEGNRRLMDEMEGRRREREATLTRELASLRHHSGDALEALQGELDELRLAKAAVDSDVLYGVVARERAERELVGVLGQQRRLHDDLQAAKRTAMESSTAHETTVASASPSRGGRPNSGNSNGCCRCQCGGSPARRPFVPSGPKGRRAGESDGGGGCSHGYDDDGRSGISTRGSPRTMLRMTASSSSPHHHGHGRPAAFAHSTSSPPRWAPLASPSHTATYNVPAILSTIERANILRPRRFLQRRQEQQQQEEGGRGRDPMARYYSNGEVGAGDDDGGLLPVMGSRDGGSGLIPPPPPPLLVSRRESHRYGHSEGSSGSPPPPPREQSQEHSQGRRQSSRSYSPVSPLSPAREQPRPASPPPSTAPTVSGGGGGDRDDDVTTTTTTITRLYTSGRALDAACATILAELQSLRDCYAHCQQRLRDPACDSVDASREMRRTLAVMDRKADQLRALRAQQREQVGHGAFAPDVLKEAMAENRRCAAVYGDILQLSRA